MCSKLLKIFLILMSSAVTAKPKKDYCKNPFVKLQKLFEITIVEVVEEVIEYGMCNIDDSPSFMDYFRVEWNRAVYESPYAEWSDSPDPIFRTAFKRRDLNEINNY
jgi:hypothetical protein